MKRAIVVLIVLQLCLAASVRVGASAMFAMSDSSAKAKAVTMWGPHASTAKFWSVGAQSNWMFQVGCYDPKNGFLIVGQSDVSWERAFASIDASKNGTFKITARARQSNGAETISSAVTVYACNAIIH